MQSTPDTSDMPGVLPYVKKVVREGDPQLYEELLKKTDKLITNHEFPEMADWKENENHLIRPGDLARRLAELSIEEDLQVRRFF